MGLFKARHGYIVLAILSFVIAACGFAGLMEIAAENDIRSVHFGLLFSFGGIFFLFCYFKDKSR